MSLATLLRSCNATNCKHFVRYAITLNIIHDFIKPDTFHLAGNWWMILTFESHLLYVNDSGVSATYFTFWLQNIQKHWCGSWQYYVNPKLTKIVCSRFIFVRIFKADGTIFGTSHFRGETELGCFCLGFLFLFGFPQNDGCHSMYCLLPLVERNCYFV